MDKNSISATLKERFCKDCGIPIKLYTEPYFTERLHLLDPYYDTVSKWALFINELSGYANEQDYLEEYARAKDAAIDYVKSSGAYEQFNQEDMSKYSVAKSHQDLPHRDIFHASNDGRTFISIDMRRANFSALQHYSRNIFGGACSWEQFLRKFTKNEHIIGSKYIRQVILGNCNPKRHITYEKHLMSQLLTQMEERRVCDNVVFFSNDEIVLDITEIDISKRETALHLIRRICSNAPVPLKVEVFELHAIKGTDGYFKEISLVEGKEKRIEFKCLDANMLPFAIHAIEGTPIQDNDRIFLHEGRLAQYIDIPEISISREEPTEEHER